MGPVAKFRAWQGEGGAPFPGWDNRRTNADTGQPQNIFVLLLQTSFAFASVCKGVTGADFNQGRAELSHLAVVTLLSGDEAYIHKEGGYTFDKRQAKRYRCEASARAGAEAYLAPLAPVVRRHMKYEIEKEAHSMGQT